MNTTIELEVIQIGSQIWTSKNLDTTKFSNGDEIQEAITDEEWKLAGEQGKPAWCNYKNDSLLGQKYGKMYNWFAINDPRGLAPKGYRIPSNKDWEILTEYLGGEDEVAGGKMKSATEWHNNGNGTNQSKFNGLAGGYRDTKGPFDFLTGFGYWWASNQDDENSAWNRSLAYNHNGAMGYITDKQMGLSVRCVKISE
jgi:uncharacterized protein (TIGR02145 family)